MKTANLLLKTGAVTVLALAIAGCGPRRVFQSNAERMAYAGPIPYTTARGAEVAPSAELPAEPTLSDYIAYALASNPGIRAAASRLSALEQGARQAPWLDDPMVGTRVGLDPVQTAAGPQNASIGASQRIPFPAKLAARTRAADEAANAARERLADVEDRVVRDTKNAYYASYLTFKALRIVSDSKTLLNDWLEVVRAKLQAGTGRQQDLFRVQTSVYNLDNRIVAIKKRIDTTRARLNTVLNRPVDAPLSEPADFEPTGDAGKLEELLAATADKRPELRAAERDIARAKELVGLAKLYQLPDFLIGVDYIFTGSPGLSPVANGDDAALLSVGMTVPLWIPKNRARITEARARADEARSRYFEARNRAFFEVSESRDRVESARRRLTIYDEAILPQARDTTKAALADYQADRGDFLDVIDAWRKLLDHELDRYRVLTDLEQALADLERAVGSAAAPAPPEE